jgi:nicotinamidase-related amidase
MDAALFHKDSVALVVIDLQKGIATNRALEPHAADVVVSNAAKLAEACRRHKIPVILVHVQPSAATRLAPAADTAMQRAPPGPDWADFVAALTPAPEDVVITKQQWGAFFGTDLDLQLRRRHLKTIILCGISTNIGVESTARDAYERGFEQVFVEDAMSAMTAQEHAGTIRHIFKRIGRVRSTAEVLEQLRT